MRVTCVLGAMALLLVGLSARAEIYRCDGAFGEPSYSHRPCREGSSQAVPQAPTRNAEGAGLRASERAWLREREQQRAAQKKRPKRSGMTQSKMRQAESQQAYRCRTKRRALDAVKRELRRGYKPAKGDRLRARRRAYADYIATFCS
ncbi:MAG: DUF4124 domain-containing protein [Chromatiaceae bacterium]